MRNIMCYESPKLEMILQKEDIVCASELIGGESGPGGSGGLPSETNVTEIQAL